MYVEVFADGLICDTLIACGNWGGEAEGGEEAEGGGVHAEGMKGDPNYAAAYKLVAFPSIGNRPPPAPYPVSRPHAPYGRGTQTRQPVRGALDTRETQEHAHTLN